MLKGSIQQSSGRIDSGSYAVKLPRTEPGGVRVEGGEDVKVGDEDDEDVIWDEDVILDDEDVIV